MEFTTPVKLETQAPIPLGTPLLSLGSCFADRVGNRLLESLFPATINPTGIAYNPISLARCLHPHQAPSELFLHQGQWRSLLHHSRLSESSPMGSLGLIRQADSRRLSALRKAKILLLTLGTAQVFELRSRALVVANCHRLPQELFRRRRLSSQEAVASLLPPLSSWLQADPERRVLLTVSPVRYLRDGLVDNSRGKASLLLCCDELVRRLDRAEYFPAYEMMMDELRDYRFYQADMLQPTEQAVDYIWERFSQSYFRQESRTALHLLERIQKLTKHRVGPHSQLEALQRKGQSLLSQLREQAPGLDLSLLQEHFQNLT